MSDLVAASEIEDIVGRRRHFINHYARAVSDEQTVYILHSTFCLGTNDDLRECGYSLALDRGIDLDAWDGFEDMPVRVVVAVDRLVPLIPVSDGGSET